MESVTTTQVIVALASIAGVFGIPITWLHLRANNGDKSRKELHVQQSKANNELALVKQEVTKLNEHLDNLVDTKIKKVTAELQLADKETRETLMQEIKELKEDVGNVVKGVRPSVDAINARLDALMLSLANKGK